MRREMRRTDRQLTGKEAEEILQEGQYGVLATVCEDGYPYGLPLSYAYREGKIYFHRTCEKSLMSDNVKGDTKASFTVVGETEVLPAKFSTKYESVIVFGTLRESKEKIEGLMSLVEKYSPAYWEKGRTYAESAADKVTVYELEVEQVTGKARR